MKLQGARIFVTGSSGFIGGFLCNALLQQGGEVKVLIRSMLDEAPMKNHGMIPILGDVNSPDILNHAINNCDIVCHLAVGIGKYDAAKKINVEGIKNVLDAAHSGGVKKVVVISSIAVYGSDLPDLVEENYPLTKTGNPYEVTKAEAEQVVSDYREKYNLDITIIRPTIVYGPKSPLWTISLFDRVKNDEIILIDKGNALMNLIYIDDLIDLILKVIEHPESINGTFHANNPEHVTWAEYLGELSKMLGKYPPKSISLRKAKYLKNYYLWQYRFTRISGPLTGFDIREQQNKTLFSSKKAELVLGFVPNISFHTGMDKIKNWLLEEGYITS